MPLHARDEVRAALDDSVYASQDLAKAAPKYRFPQAEWRSEDAFAVVADELMLDGNARQNLATFCQTWEEPAVHRLMDLAIDKNMIDKDEYPQTAEIERRCVHMLADLWNAPDAANTVGASAIGSSEACMLGGMAAKWRWRAKRAAEGKPTDRPNMVCGPVQVVWHKFVKYWDIEMREVPMAPDHYAMDVDDMLARVDENTIMVVPTFGVTYTGAYEPVRRARRRPRRPAGAHGARRRHARRRRQRGVPRPVLRPGPRLGLPAAAGQVDQHVRPQVRAGPARRRLDHLARRRRAARTT